MADEDMSLEEGTPEERDNGTSLEKWIAEEQARLEKGFTYEPKPASAPSRPGTADQIAAGLGLGAGVVAGAAAPHPSSVTFEGCTADVIVTALRTEIADHDIRVQVDRTRDSVVVTVLQSQAQLPHQFSPAVSVVLIEKPDVLTVTVSDLSEGVKRSTLGSMGRTVLNKGARLLFRRRGVGGLVQTASDMVDGVEDLVEDIQDLGLPKRVWEVIDRVGEATERTYLAERRKQQEIQWQRTAAERAWTHCESCGRAFREDEASRVDCPSCGAPRGSKPDWLQ
jgi:hypothetical protein